MTDQQPQKGEGAESGGGGKRSNRRYFRKRNKNKGSEGGERGAPSQGSPSQGKEQNRSQPDAKAQNQQTSEQRERRRKRRRSNSNSNASGNNSGGNSDGGNSSGGNSGSRSGRSGGGGNSSRRRSSSRRQRRQEQPEVLPPVAPETERYREPVDVYVHTHIVRPAYRDAGNDYVSEKSFLSKRPPAELTIHMERLQEEINIHLDEYFNRPNAPVKVTRESGDEDWDDEE